jgi:hypothetical protein
METNAQKAVVRVMGLVVLLVGFSAIPGAEPVLIEKDTNGDGKPDLWLKKDDRATTRLVDHNYDGRPDEMRLTRKLGEYGQITKWWLDLDCDGNYDELRISASGTTSHETWQRNKGKGASFSYYKYDEKSRLMTEATALALGSRVLTGVTTRPCADFVDNGHGGWTDYKERLCVYCSDEGALRSVRSWDDTSETVLRNFVGERPQVVTVKEWDSKSSGTKRLTMSLLLTDALWQGRWNHFHRERFENGTTETLCAIDHNSDGVFDWFYVSSFDGSSRIETDKDFDGLLDWVETRAADGTTTTLVGEQIPDRKLPLLPIPEENIKALLERAKEGPRR